MTHKSSRVFYVTGKKTFSFLFKGFMGSISLTEAHVTCMRSNVIHFVRIYCVCVRSSLIALIEVKSQNQWALSVPLGCNHWKSSGN